MRPKAKILFVCLFFVIVTSCDPPHYIDFVNNTKSNAKVKLNIDNKTESHGLRSIANGDSIVFNLKPKDTASIHFGIGTWSTDEIDAVANSIKNIKIETENITTIYKTKSSIKNILENNKDGFFTHLRIEIQIK